MKHDANNMMQITVVKNSLTHKMKVLIVLVARVVGTTNKESKNQSLKFVSGENFLLCLVSYLPIFGKKLHEICQINFNSCFKQVRALVANNIA